jgi:hypothetical protein
MGSVSKVFKKVTKAVTKPISKAFKGVAKGIMKVGKATLRGVAKVQNKLGPLGSIALAVAMPYALSGLSSMVGQGAVGVLGPQIPSGMMASQNLFIKSIGNLGNAIRTGYSQATLKVGSKLNSITKSITKGFSDIGKGNNIFSRISNGAKELFNTARTKINGLKKYTPKPFKGPQGTVQVGDMGYGFGETTTMSSAQASKALELGQISGEQLSGQTLGKSGWFTQGSVASDNLITETINDAYKSKLDTFSPDMKRYFTDRVNYEKKLGTYVNDALTGNDAMNANGVSRYFGDTDMLPEIQVDLLKTGDYNMRAGGGGQGTFEFTGNKNYSNQVIKNTLTESNKLLSAAKKTAMGYGKSLLTAETEKISPYYMGQQDMTMQTGMSGYGGTDIQGTAGGSFVEDVFGGAAANNMRTYYKNMNLLNGGSF